MHKKFDSAEIEKKWQNTWREKNIYKVDEVSNKPKTYVLDMFPYPSGEGLHVGHPKGYIATDIYSRFKRMTGHEVLHPMGWDAFGLPAENYAIKNKVHPSAAVATNVARFKKQLEILGFDYDWDREINTTDPEFYKWTQWIFIQLFKKGLATQSYEPINWCPGCQTGLANEDLESDGSCERCGSVVEKKPMRQWILDIKAYADRMLEDLNTLTWPEHIKEAQRNWIGRSEGAEIDFTLSTSDKVTVFTTRPDTLFGVTYLVLAPEHNLVSKNKGLIKNWNEVEAYIKKTAEKKEMDRLDDTKEKTGVLLEGVTATNPVNGEVIPVYLADYVLASYGTGAIMAVPAHDERDHAFAKKFGLNIIDVVAPYVVLTGKDAPQTDKDIHQFKASTVIAKHWSEDKYYVVTFTDNLCGFVGGSREENETGEETAIRELTEESGYTEIKNIKYISSQYSRGYKSRKSREELCSDTCYLIELSGDTRREIIDEETKKGTWCSAEEILSNKSFFNHHLEFFKLHLKNRVYTAEGKLINSGEFDGMNSEEAGEAIVKKVDGRIAKTYKIKDWVFSRQRYWGEPIPVVHTKEGAVYPIAQNQLPVTLPEVEHYEPAGDGQSPLATIENWVNVTGYVTEQGDFIVSDTAPEGVTLIEAKRETNTMPQWAGSSWYYLRYMDPRNTSELVSKEIEKAWAPVDVYVGGDHAVRHLIYARFWHKFLYDIGVVSTIEPFQRLEFLGFILAEDGRKMSKRWGNVINPDDIVKLVGADTLRVYEMFMGPFENTIAWSQDGLVGARRFLERVYGLDSHITEQENQSVTTLLHKSIKKVTEDIEGFKFNTAVSTMMIFINKAEKEGVSEGGYRQFLKLLAPFAPHLTEELWHQNGQNVSIHLETFPVVNPDLIVDESVTIGVQINGKLRGSITISPTATEEEALAEVDNNHDLKARIAGTAKIKTVYVPGRILNMIVKEA